MFNNQNLGQKFIELDELKAILKLTDDRSVKRWCKEKGIPIQSLCRKQFAYRFLVEIELDKTLIIQLKKKYPEKWEELYLCYAEDDRYSYINLLESHTPVQSDKRKKRSKEAMDFLQENST